MTITLGLVGLGKIARDQHLPAIDETAGLRLAAIASRHGGLDHLPHHSDIGALLDAGGIKAITLCTPPQGRFDQARAAIDAGCHVMLEKPPGMTVAEVQELARMAAACGVTLFTTWHSREAAAVDTAREWLANRDLQSVRITWKEDVRHWHPGQDWIWQAGGLGVFDPGINALSILTYILPLTSRVTQAALTFPSNRAAPIAAQVHMQAGTTPIEAEFDWRQTGPQTWDIEVVTDQGTLRLSHGGSRLHIDGEERMAEPDREYARLYARFVQLIGSGTSDVDVLPLQLVADAFLLADRHMTEAFHE